MERRENLSYESIIGIVRAWTSSQRFALVQDILKTLAPEEPRAKKQTLAKALGLAATENRPPDDEEVRKILEEARLEKYS